MSFQPTNDNQIKGASNKSAPTKTDKLKNKQRVKAIHAKIKNTRQDLIHKFTTVTKMI